MLRGCILSHRQPSRAATAQRGFTVVAMAAILMVAAITISMLLPDDGAINANRIRITQERMDRIHHALENYALAKGNLLPCPARLDRIYSATQFQQSVTECDRAALSCDATVHVFNGLLCAPGSNIIAGAVPVAQLNLDDTDMIDGWGNKFYYVIDASLTRIAMVPSSYTSMIQIFGIETTEPKTMNGKQLINTASQKALGVLISPGANANGAFGGNGIRRNCNTGSYDGQNCDFDTDMLQYTADRFRNEDGEFDDIVMPIILESRSCKEPVPCANQVCTLSTSCTLTTPKANTPDGCVWNDLAPIRSDSSVTRAWPIGPGNNTAGSTRTRAGGGLDLICCDGQWKLGGC